MKYGPVRDCVVIEMPEGTYTQEEDKIRTLVAFEKQESAIKAYRDLNGRYFGGRQIGVSFYNEAKFDRLELQADPQ